MYTVALIICQDERAGSHLYLLFIGLKVTPFQNNARFFLYCKEEYLTTKPQFVSLAKSSLAEI